MGVGAEEDSAPVAMETRLSWLLPKQMLRFKPAGRSRAQKRQARETLRLCLELNEFSTSAGQTPYHAH